MSGAESERKLFSKDKHKRIEQKKKPQNRKKQQKRTADKIKRVLICFFFAFFFAEKYFSFICLIPPPLYLYLSLCLILSFLPSFHIIGWVDYLTGNWWIRISYLYSLTSNDFIATSTVSTPDRMWVWRQYSHPADSCTLAWSGFVCFQMNLHCLNGNVIYLCSFPAISRGNGDGLWDPVSIRDSCSSWPQCHRLMTYAQTPHLSGSVQLPASKPCNWHKDLLVRKTEG